MSLSQTSVPFLDFLEHWLASLPAVNLADVVANPNQTALIAVDIVNGFCHQGALASPRVAGIIPAVARIMTQCHQASISDFLLLQEGHSPNAYEFSDWGEHCVLGSAEADTIPEIKALPFFNTMRILYKESTNPAINTSLDNWLETNHHIDTFIIMGDVTDICVHQLALHLRTHANAFHLKRRIFLPENCTQTFDIPVAVAEKAGILPHDGDLFHALFLYQMAQNGITIIKDIQ